MVLIVLKPGHGRSRAEEGWVSSPGMLDSKREEIFREAGPSRGKGSIPVPKSSDGDRST